MHDRRVSPACTHSCRNTELSTCRAAGLRPNETFEMPRVVAPPGSRRLSSPDRLDRLDAVPAGLLLPGGDREGQASRRGCRSTCMPQSPVRSSISRSATRTFQSAVRAWPSSSMVSATTAAPCSPDQRHHPLEARAGAVAVLEVHRVDDATARRAAPARPRSPSGSVESSMIGRVEAVANRPASSAHVRGAVAADVVDAEVEQVRAVAGLLAGDLDAVLPVARPASPRGTPWSRWRWSAPPPSARRRPGANGTGGRARRRPAPGAGGAARASTAAEALGDRRGCAPGWCRSSRRPAAARTR